MPHRDSPAICGKIDAALDYMTDDGDDLRPWLTWQLEEILGGPLHIGMEDCKPSELMALLAIYVPIFNRRILGGEGDSSLPVEGKLLTLILGGEAGGATAS